MSSYTLKTEKQPTKVVIIEDHTMFREWLSQMITKGLNAEVCGEAANIRDGLKLIQKTQPNITIVDISLPGSSGLELIKDLKSLDIDVPVLVLSMHDETLYAERVLRAGARGYITKLEASTTLLKAIRQVLRGEIYLGEKMTSRVLERMSGRSSSSHRGVAALADRELEVFQLMGKGRNAREIAEQLNLGETTIDSYRARIKEKLSLRSAAEVYSYAAQWMQEQGV